MVRLPCRAFDSILDAGWGRKRVRMLRERWTWHVCGIVLTFNATAFTFIFFQVRPERIMEVLLQLSIP